MTTGHGLRRRVSRSASEAAASENIPGLHDRSAPAGRTPRLAEPIAEGARQAMAVAGAALNWTTQPGENPYLEVERMAARLAVTGSAVACARMRRMRRADV